VATPSQLHTRPSYRGRGHPSAPQAGRLWRKRTGGSLITTAALALIVAV
jgi:hypothetical protein